MDLYPAIDLRGGRCVRLYQGDYGQETVYGDDPVAQAVAFAAAGAGWIHVVDLDAARSGIPENREVVAAIAAAVELLRDSPEHQGAVLVVDDDGKLCGIFSERDILNRVMGKRIDPDKTTLDEVMTKSPLALKAGDKIADALHHMAVRGFRNIPIVKDDKPIGIVFTRHFVKFIVSLFPNVSSDLPAANADWEAKTVQGRKKKRRPPGRWPRCKCSAAGRLGRTA